jgi:hypothetical protein
MQVGIQQAAHNRMGGSIPPKTIGSITPSTVFTRRASASGGGDGGGYSQQGGGGGGEKKNRTPVSALALSHGMAEIATSPAEAQNKNSWRHRVSLAFGGLSSGSPWVMTLENPE